MSEYQYYEFRAIDRPLSEADRRELRKLSTRARITATSFTNHYNFGDFRGDPAKLMRRWFDLHVYKADWGSRRLMIRLPKGLLQPGLADLFLRNVEDASLTTSGDNLILDISLNDLEQKDDDYLDDGSRWAPRLAALRADVLGGDLRVFYLLWLMAVESGDADPAEPEPLPGIGPLTAALKVFVDFIRIDPDLAHAAAERAGAMAESKSDALPRRTAGELLARATVVHETRIKRQATHRARALNKQLESLRQRGEAVWDEIESNIALRLPARYDKACKLLRDLKTLAELDRASEEFNRRLSALRKRHSRKRQFIVRLEELA